MATAANRLNQLKRLAVDIAQDLARSEALFLSIGEGAVATDREGRIERVNTVAEEILGFSEGELVGKPLDKAIVSVDERGEPIPASRRPLARVFKTNETVSARSYYRRKDGTFVPVTTTASPIRLNDRTIGVIGIFRDITEEIEIERTKSGFISIASHQLRTPATAVKTYLSMLLDGYAGDLTEKQIEYIKTAFESNERQLQIVNDLLSAATTESGTFVLSLAPVNLSTLVVEVAKGFTSLIQSHKQTLKLAVDDSISLTADASYLKIVVENLISNAIKYTNDGGSIWVSLHEKENTVELVVRDTGVGINKTQLHNLFKKFSRIDNPLSSVAGGSGIGLYLIKQIVDLHKGKVTVTSEEGKGTTFTVVLPKAAHQIKVTYREE